MEGFGEEIEKLGGFLDGLEVFSSVFSGDDPSFRKDSGGPRQPGRRRI